MTSSIHLLRDIGAGMTQAIYHIFHGKARAIVIAPTVVRVVTRFRVIVAISGITGRFVV